MILHLCTLCVVTDNGTVLIVLGAPVVEKWCKHCTNQVGVNRFATNIAVAQQGAAAKGAEAPQVNDIQLTHSLKIPALHTVAKVSTLCMGGGTSPSRTFPFAVAFQPRYKLAPPSLNPGSTPAQHVLCCHLHNFSTAARSSQNSHQHPIALPT